MTLPEAVLARLRHVNDWRGPGELTKSVSENCTLCINTVATIASVREALEVLADTGLAVSDGNGKWRAATEVEVEAFQAGQGSAEDWKRRKRLLLALAKMLEGTLAGDDLLKVEEVL